MSKLSKNSNNQNSAQKGFGGGLSANGVASRFPPKTGAERTSRCVGLITDANVKWYHAILSKRVPR